MDNIENKKLDAEMAEFTETGLAERLCNADFQQRLDLLERRVNLEGQITDNAAQRIHELEKTVNAMSWAVAILSGVVYYLVRELYTTPEQDFAGSSQLGAK